ncbi:MAG: gldN, partial [Chitinophagaceae bacterium]|nr:gldN [Chitinophagaceae bacterium]
QPQQQQNNNAATKYNPYGNTPIEVAPVTGGFNDTIRKSMRNDGAVERSVFKDRIPLAYEHLRADDALFMERVWREIDIREKINQTFGYKSDDDNGNQRFINIMVNAVRNGKVTAFSADDDRFTTPLDSLQFEKVISGGGQCDTLPVYDLLDPTKITKYVVTCGTLNPDEIVKFRLKEDWVFDRESSRMVCRIIGIAPCRTQLSIDKKTERGVTPMFWIYYPDLRETLARAEVYNPKNMGVSRLTWEELFETRMFNSYITKSTIDNPGNKYIRSYVKDPILALLEGDNIKNKIFDYEQNLWSY